MYYTVNWLYSIIMMGVALGAVLGTCAYLILLERKVSAWMQDRLGPNRVGPGGLFQPIADGLKFILKEDVIPSHVDKLFYLVAPAIAVSTALFAIVVVPFGPTEAPPQRPWPETRTEEARLDEADPEFKEAVAQYDQKLQFVIAPHVDIGFLLVSAVGSLAVYGIILGGWSSNNKYSLLGSLRSSAQIISYEIPMGMSVLGVLLLSGSLNLERIIDRQVWVNGWNIVYQPLAFVLFLTSIFAECNRLPFDLPEAEQELVGGYHTEYSAMKFALFFLGEYAHMITTSFLITALFLGGWYVPYLVGPGAPLAVQVVAFAVKMFAFILFSMFIRWTIPRFRFDQLMGLAWKVFIPLTLVNLVLVMVVQHLRLPLLWLLPASLVVLVGAAYLAMTWREEKTRKKLVVYRGHQRVEIPAP
jgi:NADH-quinone oxidoreductase subunit H